jgi:hypothetical protein
MAGQSGKPVAQKLGLKPGFCIFVDGAPRRYDEIVGGLPVGAKLLSRLKASLDVAHLFASRSDGLAGKLASCRDAIAPDGALWVSWPKKSSGVVTDLSDVVVRDIALQFGLVDIKVCAIDDVWSGLKFVIPKNLRARKHRAFEPSREMRGKVRPSGGGF